jgi:(p)ppGpp synthase/HD superfamily hydrolase
MGLFTTEIKVRVQNHVGVLAQAAERIAATETNIDHVHVTNEQDETALITFELKVRDRTHLASVLRALRSMPDVMQVERTTA